MNPDRLRPVFRYVRPLTSSAITEGIVWRFDVGRPSRMYFLVYEASTRRFRAGWKHPNGYGTFRSVWLPRKVAILFRSMLPENQIARAFALSLAKR